MILSGSLWPGMTRGGFAYSLYVPVSSRDRDAFPVTVEGERWLSTTAVVKKELMAARHEMSMYSRRSLAARAFQRIDLDDTTGCWLSDLPDLADPAEHTKALWAIATLDMKGRFISGQPLDAPEDKEHLRVCDNPACLNARHYDFTHERPYRKRILRPDYRHYQQLEDGSILPLWEKQTGVILPSVGAGVTLFRELQSQCIPYTDHPELAPLTGNGISKITIDPVTGCWPVRQYYTRPEDAGLSFQYDGYGRLGLGPGLRSEGERPYQQMGHRVLARAFGLTLEKGKVLNHECGFRPCCNPLHLSQVSYSKNVLHGRSMSKVRQASQDTTTVY